jgi:uncharacterized protein YggE
MEKRMSILRYVVCLLLISNLAYAGDEIRRVSVTGKPTITLEAPYSIIHTSVKRVSPEIDKSHKDLNQTLFMLFEKLKGIGLSDKEIVKSIISQGSEFRWERNTKKLIGYYSSSNVQLRVNNLSLLPRIYSELSKHNSVTINSTEYGRNDEFEKRNEEFKKALVAAKTKAHTMAETLDVKVGPVIRIEEIGSGGTAPRQAYANVARAPIRETGGSFGSVKISAMVAVEFELK